MEIVLSNKVAIVTGGGSGIGRASSLAFASAGASVAVVDLNEELAQNVAREIEESGGRAVAIQADVSSSTDVQRMIRETVEAFDGIDILYNNAGISPEGNVTETSESLWEKTLAIDLTSVFLGAKYAIPIMKEQGGGVILNTAGTLGLMPSEGKTAYAAAKAGVISLTRSIALDYAGDEIRCNAICPGLVPGTQLDQNTTQITTGSGATSAAPSDQYEKNVDVFFDFQPLKGAISPEQIGALAVYLASDVAKMITGQSFVIDGGQIAGLH